MRLIDAQSLLIMVWEVGYMEAMRAFEPARDEIRKAELKEWLELVRIDKRDFRKMEKAGLIKGRKLGYGKNSPFIYSKTEIKKALATREATRLMLK